VVMSIRSRRRGHDELRSVEDALLLVLELP
jgi:hypothetical protein